MYKPISDILTINLRRQHTRITIKMYNYPNEEVTSSKGLSCPRMTYYSTQEGEVVAASRLDVRMRSKDAVS
jgi:hypothetical protein